MLGQILIQKVQKAGIQLADTLIRWQIFLAPSELFYQNFFLIRGQGIKSSQEFNFKHLIFIFSVLFIGFCRWPESCFPVSLVFHSLYEWVFNQYSNNLWQMFMYLFKLYFLLTTVVHGSIGTPKSKFINYNPEQNIWNKVDESSNVGQDK